MTFSQRMGLVSIRDAIQYESLDEGTRNAIWNLLLPFFQNSPNNDYVNVHKELWTQLYENPADRVPRLRGQYEYDISDRELYCRYFRQKVIEGEWNECLDLVEYLIQSPSYERWVQSSYDDLCHRYLYHVPTRQDFNGLFEQYVVGFRFVGNALVKITSLTEIESIEAAVKCSKSAVREQLQKALLLFSDRKHPDYAKSVQCSISAVEAQCSLLLNSRNVTLGAALKELESRGVKMHPALKGGLSKLYGYTSDADGIRHASISASEVDQDLAKFMLVSCSAFVNYLLTKG